LRFHHRCHRRRRLQLPVHFNFDKKLSTWYGIIQHHNEFTQDEKEDELKNYSSEPTIIPSIFTQQEQRQQRQQQSCDSTHYIDDEVTQPHPQQEQQSYMTLPRRQFLIASSTIFLATQFQFPTSSNAAIAASSSLTEKVNFQQSPINKRNGITLAEPERIYPLSFITYLSRFLLVFDDQCQTWWYTQARAIPAKSSKEEVERIRLSQFGEFAASVEVGLIDFEGGGGADDGGGSDARAGVEKLLNSLVKRYGPSSLPVARENDPSAANDSSTSSAASSSSSTTTAATATTKGPTEREIIKSKEALRQIALLFSLLEEYQPVEAITRLLAADDDAKIIDVEILDGGAGYYPPSTTSYPSVTFPDPPTLGTEFGGSIAKGVAVMKPSGRLLTIELTYGGSGYVTTPLVDISYPIVTTIGVDGGGNNTNSNDTNDTQVERVQATARAILGKKTSKGRIVDRIELLTPGMGYNISDGITVTISPPGSLEGETATARAILEYEVSGIEIVDKGSGYAAERPINVVIDPPPAISSTSVVKPRSAFAVSYPKGKSTSYGSFIDPRSASVISASISNVDTSQWIAGPTSSQLTALLPSGFGLQYDETLQRYILSRYSSTNDWNDILSGSLEGKKLKPVNPIFGFRGRSPIEKEKTLDLSKVVRFMASGGICSSVAHLILTPIDVVKTKVQTRPEVYNDGIIGTFTKVLNEEGVETFFDGWEPTVVGFFFSGAFGFFLTEYFRRYYTSLVTSIITMPEVGASTVISSLEIPLIVASAATSGFFCCFVLAPFDAVRIRTVSQPDYAENIFGVVTRMVKEEGLSSLFSAVPVWFVKEIPYNVFKFLVFDTSTEFMYEAYPAAREDIRLSLLVSLCE
jgi:hypothetical protein